MSGLLTEAELRCMDLTAELVDTMCAAVIGSGPSRAGDIRELAESVHRIQNMILAQAAARAYPDRFRLLGESIPCGT